MPSGEAGPGPAPARGPVPGERAFVRMAAAIGLVSVLVFGWFLTLGRPNLVQYRGFGEVFDLQARALLQGRLSLPAGSLGFEGFLVDGKTYAYFGVFPALLRIPLFLVTDHFDGRLSAASMLIAYVIALWSAVAVVRRVRALLRPGQAWTRTGLVVAGLLLAVVGIGSNLLFLASGAWVYHEASLWGAAAVLASFAATLRFLDRGRMRSIVAAGLWAAVAWTSRGSVGLAPSAVLGLLGLAHLTGHRWLSVLAPPPSTRGRRGAGEPGVWPRDFRRAAVLLVASVAGALVFGTINAAKFGSPTSLPMDKQVASFNPWPDRARALEVYDGSLFSTKLIPSVVYQSLRPDLLRPARVWPFFTFSEARPPVWGNLVFDTVEPSAGLTVTSPLLLVLGGVGCVSALRRRRTGGPSGPVRAAVLRPFLLGGLAAAYAPLTIAFIAQRYLTDALPFLIVGAAGGVSVIDGWAARRGRRAGPTAVRSAVFGLAVVAVFGAVTTFGVTWSFQRFVIPPDPAARAAALRTQMVVSRRLGDPPTVHRYATLPGRSPGEQLAIVGHCDGLYQGQSDGGWSAIEVSAARGHHRLELSRSGPSPEKPELVLAMGPRNDEAVLLLVHERGADRFQLRRGNSVRTGKAVDLSGGPHQLDVLADPTFSWTTIDLDGRQVLFAAGTPPRPTPAPRTVWIAGPAATFGRSPNPTGAPRTSHLATLPSPTPTCDLLLAAPR